MARTLSMCLLCSFVTATVFAQTLDIKLAHDSKTEQQTKVQLERLLKTCDLSPWIYTKAIVVDDKAVPHSHPVLTLHTRHLRDDALLLSTVVHEEFHWFFVQHDADTQAALTELQVRYPSVPPEGATG